MVSILHLQEIPSSGGDTLFANMYDAYEALSDSMKAFFNPLEALHQADYNGFYGDHSPRRETPSALHSVIRTLPVTGRQTLYVNSGFTRRICGVTRAERDALLRLLFEHGKNPIFHCRFSWQRNFVAM